MTGWISALLRTLRPQNPSTIEKSLDAYEKGVAAIANGKTTRAIDHFSTAISISPNSSKLYHHRADAFALNNQHKEAIVDYDVAVRLGPSYPDTYLDRGNSRYEIGDLTYAVKDFSEAIRLKPEWAEAYANRAVAHAELSNDTESEQDATKAKCLGVSQPRLNEMLQAARNGDTDDD